MATTAILQPRAQATLGTGLGDGTTYGSWTGPDRLFATATGTSIAASATAAGIGNVWTDCFHDNQIPSGATITGVELVAGTDPDGSGNSYFATAAFGHSSAEKTLQVFFYNGTSYSSAVTFPGSLSTGVTLNGAADELTFTGNNRFYVNSDATEEVLAGANDSLFGLSWDPSNQSDFGFAVTVLSTNAFFSIPLLIRGIGMRITYSTGFADKVIGEPPADILKVLGIATANLANIAQPGNTTEPTPYELFYQFESETAVINTGSWSPGNNWVNGTSATDGTYWGRDSNKTVKGWNLDTGTTPSGSTGPSNGVDVSDGSHASATKYMYTEVTSSRHLYAFVTRMPVFNSSNMSNSGNDLDLKFWVHAYGSQIGDLYVYIHTATTANHSSATELAAYESFSGYTATSSVWQQKTISLNSYRNGADYYIYFVSQNATGFRGDLAVDAVQIIES